MTLPQNYNHLRMVGDLTPQQHRQLVCALSMLWDERLAERARSKISAPPDPPDKRYAMHMRLTALQIRYCAGPQKQHYALAPELMALYADKINKLAQTSTDRETIHEIEVLISQGALLRGAAVQR